MVGWTMRYWIEVTTGMRIERMIQSGFLLEAPKTTRYCNFFRNVRAGDTVLHYTTQPLTRKEWKSSIIAVSKVESDPVYEEKKILAACKDTIFLKTPVSYGELMALEPKSSEMKAAARIRLQKYLNEISFSDFAQILSLHSNNIFVMS